jgi:hypothetical protein
MSYKQSYSATVPYSGSVSVSYPASEKGGSKTVSYHGEVPVNVTINVNTNPFEGSIHNCNDSIDRLTGSVVAMNAAQCAAIQQTTKEVSQSIIDGFFGTIKTELSQQLQALDSAIKAKFGLIQTQGKAVSNQKAVMETDYNRISSRYVTLFADLDRECYKRIYALDKQSFSLSEKVQKELLNESTADAAALNMLEMQEESASKMLLLAAGLYKKAREVLRILHDYITQESRLTALVNAYLFTEQAKERVSMYVPVIWAESDSLEGSGANQEHFIPSFVSQEGKKEIAERTNAFCSDSTKASWYVLPKEEREGLNRELNGLAETFFENAEEERDRRIYKTMLSLWQKNVEVFSLGRRLS